MALAQTLQDQLTCPVCQDLFTRPQVLKCHHSLCEECLGGLRNASLVRWKVECPVCRKPCEVADIQHDFRTVTLLEAHSNASAATELKGPQQWQEIELQETADSHGLRKCDICKEFAIKQLCNDCDKLLCERCTVYHPSIPACSGHTLTGPETLLHRERAVLQDRATQLKREQVVVEEKVKEIGDFKNLLESEKNRALSEVNNWYDNIVQKASKRRDTLIKQITSTIDSEKEPIQEKERIVTAKKENLTSCLEKIQNAQNENDLAKLYALKDSLTRSLDEKNMEFQNMNVVNINIPNPPHFNVHLGKRWDETKSINIQEKKQSSHKQLNVSCTFPASFTSSQLVMDTEVAITRGAKQVMCHSDLLWVLYDDHIDIYNTTTTTSGHNRLVKSIKNHIAVPNGMCVIANGNVVVACMSKGLAEFSHKGKYLGHIAEGSVCDVTFCHKTIYTLDYSDNRPYLKAFKKTHFNKWKNILDREVQNDQCNTFNTLLSNQTSIYLSAVEENVLIEYGLTGELVGRLSHPHATHLCCADTWGNVLLTDHEHDQVWMLRSDQTWAKVEVDGVYRPYSVSVDGENGLWVSNHCDVVRRYVVR